MHDLYDLKYLGTTYLVYHFRTEMTWITTSESCAMRGQEQGHVPAGDTSFLNIKWDFHDFYPFTLQIKKHIVIRELVTLPDLNSGTETNANRSSGDYMPAVLIRL